MVSCNKNIFYLTISSFIHFLFFSIFFFLEPKNIHIVNRDKTLSVNLALLNKAKNTPKIKKEMLNKAASSEDSSQVPKIKSLEKKLDTNKSQPFLKQNKKNLKNKNLKEFGKLEKKTTDNQKEIEMPEKLYQHKKLGKTSIPKSNISKNQDLLSTSRQFHKQSLKDYNIYLKNIIQAEASKNYPRISIKKREVGEVEVVFSLDSEGFLKEMKIGKKTKAPSRIIKAAEKSIKRLSPFKKNTILKGEIFFSVVIIYKLN